MALYFPKITKYTLFPDYCKMKLKFLWGKKCYLISQFFDKFGTIKCHYEVKSLMLFHNQASPWLYMYLRPHPFWHGETVVQFKEFPTWQYLMIFIIQKGKFTYSVFYYANTYPLFNRVLANFAINKGNHHVSRFFNLFGH